MTIVIDASITLAWLFEDEASPAIERLFDSVAETSAVAPASWRLEVANRLRMGIRRGRIDTVFRNNALARLARLPIENDTDTALHAWDATLALSDKHALTPYDAAYLELARRRNLPLATLDRDLNKASLAEGVSLFAT